MKRLMRLTCVVSCLWVMYGCAGNQELIKSKTTSTNQNIFRVITNGAAPDPGYADLRIYSSIKTHSPNVFSDKDIHGTENYKLLLNIDGQSIELSGVLREEKNGMPCEEGPEDGTGIRYRFLKLLRVKAGTHKLFLAIPYDDLIFEREITLADKSDNNLTLKPDYCNIPKRRLGFLSKTSFKEGIKNLRFILNGQEL